jgi:hypothetical protein
LERSEIFIKEIRKYLKDIDHITRRKNHAQYLLTKCRYQISKYFFLELKLKENNEESLDFLAAISKLFEKGKKKKFTGFFSAIE